jgi:hypothetical protein
VFVLPLPWFEYLYYSVRMHSAADQNQIEIRPAGRCIKRSQRHVAANDARPAPRGGRHALASAATARQGTSHASNARPARTRYAPTLSHSRRPAACRPGRAQAAINRQRSCGNAAELAPDRCGQPTIANPRSPRATFVTGAHEGQC